MHQTRLTPDSKSASAYSVSGLDAAQVTSQPTSTDSGSTIIDSGGAKGTIPSPKKPSPLSATVLAGPQALESLACSWDGFIAEMPTPSAAHTRWYAEWVMSQEPVMVVKATVAGMTTGLMPLIRRTLQTRLGPTPALLPLRIPGGFSCSPVGGHDTTTWAAVGRVLRDFGTGPMLCDLRGVDVTNDRGHLQRGFRSTGWQLLRRTWGSLRVIDLKEPALWPTETRMVSRAIARAIQASRPEAPVPGLIETQPKGTTPPPRWSDSLWQAACTAGAAHMAILASPSGILGTVWWLETRRHWELAGLEIGTSHHNAALSGLQNRPLTLRQHLLGQLVSLAVEQGQAQLRLPTDLVTAEDDWLGCEHPLSRWTAYWGARANCLRAGTQWLHAISR